MKTFSLIYEDDHGFTKTDHYFAHLHSIQSRLPKGLFEFATDPSRYEMNGDRTLHDAWLLDVQVSNRLTDEHTIKTDVKLRLLQAMHRSTFELHYADVSASVFLLAADRWPDQPVDLLMHEFANLDDDRNRHILQFDRGVLIKLEFVEFNFCTSECSSVSGNI